MTPRRLTAVLTIALAVAAAALAGYWFWYAGQIEDGIARWAAAQQQRGYRVAYGGPVIDGFPLTHVARLEGPKIEAPSGWRWQGPALTGRMKVWNPQRIAVSFAGLHRLHGPDTGAAGGAEIESAAADAIVFVRPDGRLQGADAEISGLELRGYLAEPLRAAALRLHLQPLYPDQPTQPIHFAFDGEAWDIQVPPEIASPFDPRAEHLRAQGRLEGAIPDAAPRLALTLWRNAGGLLVLDRLELDWPPITLEATGRLTLDEALRPLGDLQARIAGLPDLFDRLAAQGLMADNQARATKLAVLALAAERDSQGRAVVELPLSFRQGYLYLGPLRLLPVSPVL
jgi:hypothetical protein